MEWLTFVLVSIGIILIPGPNVLVVISTSMTQGKVRGLQTVLGTSIAMIFQLIIAAIGTHWFVTTLANGFLWIKWAGVLYLVYLGITSLRAIGKPSKQTSGIGSFTRGFWVSLTNPKTILFFSAFLPQFVSGEGTYLSQIAMLSMVFWCLALILDSLYALLSHHLSSLLQHRARSNYQHGASAVLYLGAGALLAQTKIE